jgi:hypothetical protein
MANRIGWSEPVHRCIYCPRTFEQANREHVLQNFLGARWDSAVIVCNDCQDYFSGTIDRAFERGLQPIRNLLGTLGGRGGAGPTLKRLTTTAGEKIDLEPGAKPRLREPRLQITPGTGGSHIVQITMGTTDQLGWALAKLRKELPVAEVDQAVATSLMRSAEGFLAGKIDLHVDIGGAEFFRGIVKACFNLLAAHADDGPKIALAAEFDPVRQFIRQGGGQMTDFVRWATRQDYARHPAKGPIDHVMGVQTREGSVQGVLQLFGHLVFPVRLSNGYHQRGISYCYVVDPYRKADPAESRLNGIDPDMVPVFGDESLENNAVVQAVFYAGLTRILDHFFDRATQEILSSTLDEILQPEMGKPFTQELARRVVSRLIEKMQPFLTPHSPPG